MKITLYELLGMVKDGKAPKKIKYRDNLFEYSAGLDDYRADDTRKYHRNHLFHYLFEEEVNFLNDEVEILDDEEKELPKKLKSLNNVGNSRNIVEFEDKQQLNNHLLKDKLNEIIDYLEKQMKGE